MSGSFSRMAELPGLDGGHMGMAGFDVIDRDQGQAQVARFLEQTVERGLVGYGAMDDGGAVAVAGDGQPVEPGGPPGIEVPLEADLVPSRAVIVAGRYFAHGCSLAIDFRRRLKRSRPDRKLEADVGTRHHHTWGLMR